MKLKIGDFTCNVKEPYKKGHVISETEAGALNRARRDVIRTRLTEYIKKQEKAGKKVSKEDLQKALKYQEENFSWPAARDPMEARVNKLIADRLKQAGEDFSAEAVEKFKSENEALVNQVREAIRVAYS